MISKLAQHWNAFLIRTVRFFYIVTEPYVREEDHRTTRKAIETLWMNTMRRGGRS